MSDDKVEKRGRESKPVKRSQREGESGASEHPPAEGRRREEESESRRPAPTE